MIDLSKYRGKFALLYNDRFDVYRNGTETDANGATHNVRYSLPSLQNCACLASPDSASNATPRPQKVLDVDQNIYIHCRPELDLLSGDYIVVRKRRGFNVVCIYRGTIGQPEIYPTHIKAAMKIDSVEVIDGQ